jgi:Ca-activated chloride channel family protein
MQQNRYSLVLLLFAFVAPCFSQDDAKKVYEGNELYHSGRIGPATLLYKEAMEANPANRKANFNLGDALYKTALEIKSGKMQAPANATITADSLAGMMLDKAAEQFAVVANSVSDKDTLHRAWHNIGNSFLMKKDYGQAVEAYKKSLKFNSKDEDTRYNLAYALKHMPPEKKGGGGSSQQQKKEQKEDKKQQQQKSEMSKEQAERLLKALMDSEKKLQDKRKQKSDNSNRDVEKDW